MRRKPHASSQFDGSMPMPAAAPCDPCADLSIPGTIPGAFDDCWYIPEKKVYVHIGAQALQRRRPGHQPLAVLDPNPLDRVTPPEPTPPVTLDLSALNPNFGWGPRGTVGILWDSCALEATGYYLPETTNQVWRARPGQLTSFFVNPPVGFEGNNGLWQNADKVRVSLGSTLASGEVNLRTFSKALSGADAIVGVRYFDMQERFGFFTDDEGIVFRDFLNRPDPTRQALYTSRVHNRILAGQAGFEYQSNVCRWVALGFYGKGAWGVNFSDVDISLVRGDGLVGFRGGRSDTIFSQLYDAAGFLELHLLERLRIRAGYNMVWLLDLPVASQQVDFNLQHTNGKKNNEGSVFYHGPQIEVQFLF